MVFWRVMKIDEVKNGMDKRIGEAYALFARYKLNPHGAVCACGECLPEWQWQKLCATPLREICAEDMCAYISAMSWCERADDAAAVRESKYFLPRYLELLAKRQPVYPISEEFALSRFRFAREARWTAQERDFMQRFAEDFFTDELAREPDGLVSAVNWLVAFALADLALAPLLDLWREKSSEDSAVWHFIAMVNGIFVDEEWCFVCNYLEDKADVCTAITRWLHADATCRAFAQGCARMLATGCYAHGSQYYLERMLALLQERLSLQRKF